jgi:hypothetical protein
MSIQIRNFYFYLLIQRKIGIKRLKNPFIHKNIIALVTPLPPRKVNRHSLQGPGQGY